MLLNSELPYMHDLVALDYLIEVIVQVQNLHSTSPTIVAQNPKHHKSSTPVSPEPIVVLEPHDSLFPNSLNPKFFNPKIPLNPKTLKP